MTTIPAHTTASTPRATAVDTPQPQPEPAHGSDPGSSTGATGRSVQYPSGGKDGLQGRKDWSGFSLPAAAAGGVTLGTALGFLGHSVKYTNTYSEPRTLAAAGALVGAAVGVGLIGYAWGVLHKRHEIAHGADFDGADRPALPKADSAPTVDITSVAGTAVPGITGSSVGQVVRLTDKALSNISVADRTVTVDKDGTPTVVFGPQGGTTKDVTATITSVDGHLNAMGLGNVLGDPKGYGTLAEAAAAYDGRHSEAVVAQGGRFFLADFDAANWQEISDTDRAMVVSDPRVKMIFTNYNVYSPSNLKPAVDDPSGVTKATNGTMFVFSHGQDVETAIPASVRNLDQTTIGWYDTNGPGRLRIDRASRLQLSTATAERFSNQQEALAGAIKKDGDQAVLHQGNAYYVTDVQKTRGLDAVTADPRTPYVLGLRTTDDTPKDTIIENEGGLYAPVGDWWVQVRDASGS